MAGSGAIGRLAAPLFGVGCDTHAPSATKAHRVARRTRPIACRAMRREFSDFMPIEGRYIDAVVGLATVTHRPRCRYCTSMRTADDWFLEYGESHRHGANKLLHWVCVPAIVL